MLRPVCGGCASTLAWEKAVVRFRARQHGEHLVLPERPAYCRSWKWGVGGQAVRAVRAWSCGRPL